MPMAHPKLLAALACFDLIIFADWLRDPLSLVQSLDLLDILDRLVNNAYRLHVPGESQRHLRSTVST